MESLDLAQQTWLPSLRLGLDLGRHGSVVHKPPSAVPAPGNITQPGPTAQPRLKAASFCQQVAHGVVTAVRDDVSQLTTHTHSHSHLAFLLAAMREGLAGLCMGFAGCGAHVLVIKTHSHAYTITHNTHTSELSSLVSSVRPLSHFLPTISGRRKLQTTQSLSLSLSFTLSLSVSDCCLATSTPPTLPVHHRAPCPPSFSSCLETV